MVDGSPCALLSRPKLSTDEEELVGVLLGIVVDHAVSGAELPVLGLEGLNDGEVDHRPAKVITELLTELHAPKGLILVENKFGSAVALGASSGGRDSGKALLKLVDGLLAEVGTNDGNNRGVEGAGNNEVGHDGFNLMWCRSA